MYQLIGEREVLPDPEVVFIKMLVFSHVICYLIILHTVWSSFRDKFSINKFFIIRYMCVFSPHYELGGFHLIFLI